MDTSWINLPNNHSRYLDGCTKFMELAKKSLVEGKTKCPCKICKLRYWLTLDEVEEHILFKGFYQLYTKWIWHGDEDIIDHLHEYDVGSTSKGPFVGRDDMEGLLSATFLGNDNHLVGDLRNELPVGTNDDKKDEFGDVDIEFSSNDESDHEFDDDYMQTPKPHNFEEDVKYKRLFEAAKEELYEGCQAFSKLSFLLHLFHIKCMYHWSAESFNKLIDLILQAFPQMSGFPSSYYEGKKIINDFGLGYEKIHACPNNCILYWGEFSKKDECHVCHTSRWRKRACNNIDKGKSSNKKGEAAKVMRYFPLIPRLKRLYMCTKTAEDMRWHHESRVNDGNLRHPSDGLAWKQFDSRYPEFASDPRNVRLALATDGFNPYRLMNTTYSTWPVILIPYNLPPWLSMKPSSFILSCIIPGKSSPGIDIDVYLQPLLYELQLLWKGVNTYDAYEGNYFTLRAALHSTINDFPAYAMLSGWSTVGYDACPRCTHSTNSGRFGGKICYVGHRKWLPHDHSYRSEADLFDGTTEYGNAPKSVSGTDILRQQESIGYIYGKSTKPRKRKGRAREVGVSTNIISDDHNVDNDSTNLWNKKSVFFQLPYWEHNPLRHNLDVMHIEKNVCDNILGTILNMDKCRDDQNARLALEKLGIRKHLWLQQQPDRDPYMPPASYSMSTQEKDRFLKVLQKIRVPDGYGSNISRCVNIKQRKLNNLKSHDNHVLMQDILVVALRASKAIAVTDLLGDLSSCFKYLCSSTLDNNELDTLEVKITLTLCQMEMEFLPTFFTIMVHLIIHLVEEAKLGGPVQYRWMYPIERYLAHLKSYVSNKAQPEGSIAEGYILEETITFCSRYLQGVETIFDRSKRNDDGISDMSHFLYNSGGRVIGMKEIMRLDDRSLKQAHRYVLLHSDEMKEVLNGFLHQKKQDYHQVVTQSIENEWIINEFGEWLQLQVQNLDGSTKEGKLRKTLAGGLSSYCTRMSGYMINGYKFQTVDHEQNRKTQNSGIMVEADGQNYYGKLKGIYELDYFGAYKVVVFHCNWVDIYRGIRSNADKSVCVNFSKLMHTGRNLSDDPFVFSSQAKQVFYVEDEIQKGWLHVITTKPRDLIDTGENLA